MKEYNSLLNDDILVAMFSKLSKEVTGLMTDQLRENDIDLTKSQVIVLSKLMSRENCAQNDLALITERDKTSLTRLLSTMERKGLIVRQRSKEDRRIKEVSITEYGKEQFKIAQPIILKITKQSEQDIDKEDLDKAKEIVLKIYNNLNLKYEQ